MIIGTLGPEGSYTEKAAKKWDNGAKLRYYDDILDTVEALMRDEVDMSVVPIENSLEGSITLTLDLLMEYQLKIVGEIVIQINHCLLSKGRPDEIKIIISHPQALSQCRKYITKNFRNAEIRPTLSTSIAAKQVAELSGVAAIASRESAVRYGLDILDENIQDTSENYTRFIVIGKTVSHATGNDKTSVIIYLEKNMPGALYEILGEFAIRKIDLTKIESRPTKRNLGDYLFYIDMKGHLENAIVKDAIEKVRSKVGMLKILGSYPAAK
ncbi:MAG TPA: prephenate dehydratase [Candidatus Methanoperedens sp.]